MRRNKYKLAVVFMLALFWTACQTFSDLTVKEEERALRRLKRGTISEAGLYSNQHYEFELRLPEGWTGTVSDPPDLLKVNPSSKDISQSSMRKNVNISIKVLSRFSDESVDQFSLRYATAKGFERILERPSLVQGFPSNRSLFYGKQDSMELTLLSLFILKEKEIVVVECSAPKKLFDNFESKFGACLDSFRATGEPIVDQSSNGVFSSIDPALDFVTYIVVPGDSIEILARNFLGSEDRAWLIVSANEIEVLKAGDRIKIPRSMPYELKPDDTWPLISQKILGNAVYANTIEEYNAGVELSTVKSVQIPFYTSDTPVVGDSYIEIARRKYKDEKLAQRLLEYNNMEPLESLEKVKLPIFFVENYFSYKVQPNDTLAWIARWLTGDPNNFRQIAEANAMDAPYRLIVNQVLKIPASLVSDPTVFDKPIPKPPRAAPKPPEQQQSTTEPSTPVPSPTPTPRPISGSGLFDIE